MRFLYDLVLFFYHSSIRFAAMFNPKAKRWVDGRKGGIERIPIAGSGQKRVWMHCASLGEFEQGRPLIEAVKKKYPNCHFVLSFYSPSGYELRKNYTLADHVCYLPADGADNARRFLDKVQPDLVIFVKYEFWYHYLNTLAKRNIPTLLVAALFRPNQAFFKPYGIFFRKMLQCFSCIFVQNKTSLDLLHSIGLVECEIAGDTRIDRVLDLANSVRPLPIIEQFANGNPVFIAGSTWSADEKHLSAFFTTGLPKHWKVIIAPHEIHPQNIKNLQAQLTLSNQTYSQAKSEGLAASRILIIDNIGMLSSIYPYGKIAYIGGGFGKGIHNTLEPAVFGLPIIFGEKYQQFSESVTMVKSEAAFSIQNSTELQGVFKQLQEEAFYQKAKKNAQYYVQSNQGATQKILEYIQSLTVLQ